jgi:4'-phosphopantetheinyl transferase
MPGIRPALPMLAIADLAPAQAPAFVLRWLPRLSAGERARFDRFGREPRRRQFIAAHALLRLVAATQGIGVDRLACAVDAGGRPSIESPAGWQTSLSHSGARVVVLLDRGAAPVGVDIEHMRNDRDILAIVAAACGVEAASRESAYRAWAAHEARQKAGPPAGPGAASRPPSAWHAAFDGNALAVAGTARAPAVLHVFDLAPDAAADARDPAPESVDGAAVAARALPIDWTAG